MKKFILLLLAAFLVTSVYFGCKKNEAIHSVNTLPSSAADQSLINTEKERFNIYLFTVIPPPGTYGDPGQNKLNPLKSLSKFVAWKSAYVQDLSTVKVVVVPIYFAENLFATSSLLGKDKKLPINGIYKLLLYQDKLNIFHSEILASFPDSNYSKNPHQSFTGVTVISDWYGNSLHLFKQGHADKGSNSGTAVTNEAVFCSFIDWYSCTDVCSYSFTEDLGCSYSDGGGGANDITIAAIQYAVIGGGGSGGGVGGFPEGPYDVEGPAGYLCGSYKWKSIGEAWYTQIYNVGFKLVSRDGGLLYFMFASPCLNFSKNYFTGPQADLAFNAAWRYAVDRVTDDANTHAILGDFLVKVNMEKYINIYLRNNYGGSANFNQGGCTGSGIPTSTPSYCQ